MDVNAVRTAVIWKNDNPDVYRQLGDATWPSVAYSATSVYEYSNQNTYLYTCGVQYGYEETTYHGVIWKGSDVYYTFPDGTKLYDIAYRDGFLWTVGTAKEGGVTKLKVWITDLSNTMTDEAYMLSTDSYEDCPNRTKIFVDDAGDVYVVGVTTGYDELYKNGTEIDYTGGYYTSVLVNSNGVYYAGEAGGTGYIWKEGETLYHPTNSKRITCLYTAEPECTNSDACTLPYFEGFETGATDWACWTISDISGINGYRASYWHRGGEGNVYFNHPGATGSYYAWHGIGDNNVLEEDWLISPRINIPEGGGAVKLTFETLEDYTSNYYYEGVWVADNNDSYVEVWRQPQEQISNEWKTVEIDLSNYQGQEIRIAFKYYGIMSHNWFIDDVSIEQAAAPVEYTITTDVNPAGAGTVTGGGTYPAGTEVTLTAMANTGYVFSHWSDGLTTNPRTITVNGDANYTAYFITGGGGTMYTVTVVSENPLLGSVAGGGTYASGTVIQISATPSPNARFVSWDDGNADNPRMVIVTGDMTFVARFEALPSYTITVVSANPTMGTVDGGGTFMEGTEIQITATPFAGYYFTNWNDGNADNPRTITVTQNATYVAQFASAPVETFTLTVMCNSTEGSTIGSGTYTAGAVATIAAIPNSGYVFDKWNDDNTENPRQVTVNSNMTFVAFFKNAGVGENEGRLMVVYPNPANSYIRIEGLEANSEVKIYNAMGALVKVVNANAEEEISIGDLASGLYMVRCGNATLRFVKEQ